MSSDEDRTLAPDADGEAESGQTKPSWRGWLVVLGGFMAYFATFGLLNSFGTFQTYYQIHFLSNESSSAISWVGSVQIFTLFICGMVVGPLYDKYGARPLFVPGAIIYVFSNEIMSLCTKLYQLLLAQGLLMGAACAMLFYPFLTAINEWHDKRRGLALGLAVSGSSVGGIVWPIVIQKMLETVGFPWTSRIVGFVVLGVLLPACWLVVENKAARTVQRENEREELKKNPSVNLNMKAEFRSMLTSPPYVLLTLGFFFTYWGMFEPFYYLPLYGLEHGLDETTANNLLVLLNAGSFFGRIGSGIAADRVGAITASFTLAAISGIILFTLHSVHFSRQGIQVFSTIYGFSTGGLISLQSACIHRVTPNQATIGMRIGVLMTVCSFSVLTGAPIGGALITSKGWGAFIGFSGCVLLFGAGLILVARITVSGGWRSKV